MNYGSFGEFGSLAYGPAHYSGALSNAGSYLQSITSKISGSFQTDGAWDTKKVTAAIAAAGSAYLLIKQIKADRAAAKSADDASGMGTSSTSLALMQQNIDALTNMVAQQPAPAPSVPWTPIILGGLGLVGVLAVVMMNKSPGKA